MDRDQLREAFRERPLSEVIDTLMEVEALRRAVHATELEAIADIDAREGWRADGCASMVDWLCFKLSISRKTAHEFLDAARAMGDLPHLAAAFTSGELSWDKAKAVVELATPGSDEALTQEALETDVRHLERAARRARAVSLQEAEQRHRARYFSMRRSISAGGVRVAGFLPDIDGETLIKAIERIADDVPKDPDTDLYPSFDERCAEALVELAAGSLATEQPVHGDRAMVVVHVDLGDERADDRVELESGMGIASVTADRLGCDATLEPNLERDGKPVGVGRKTRQVPAWLMRQLSERDLGCRFPGCTRTRLVHAHHIQHWSHGGPTDRNNLVTLCRFHHRKVHEGSWSMRGDPEGSLEFVRLDGATLKSEPMKVPEHVRARMLGPVLPDG